MKNKIRKDQGITILALSVTIIILLILAGITISQLTGENGLIKNTREAKEETEKANEKEIIDRSVVQAMSKNNRGNLEEEEFQESIDGNTGGKAEVTDIGEEFEVFFKESERFYIVDKYGNIAGELEAVKDLYPGDITKDEEGNDLDGNQKPYQINCVEDLVAFSNMVNRNGKVYQNGELIDAKDSKTINVGTKIILTKSLNLKSKASYIDSERIDFGDINEIDDGNVLINELSTGLGFRPIGYKEFFYGNFDGQNNKIENVYINNDTTSTYTGLFGRGSGQNTIICNLEISGEIKGNWHTGGIIGEAVKKVENCVNRANVIGANGVGGIIGCAGVVNQNSCEIINCENYGNIQITSLSYSYGGAGGIIGFLARCEKPSIKNCKNEGKIIGNMSGGIIGCASADIEIFGCSNKGEVQGGIVAYIRYGFIKIVNSYNIGICTSGIVNILEGGANDQELGLNIQNCFVLGETNYAGILGSVGRIAKKITVNIENSYSASKSDKAIIGVIPNNDGDTEKIITIKNVYYDENKSNNVGATEEGIIKISIQNNSSFVDMLNDNIGQNTEWARWELGDEGYPILVEHN